MRLLGRERSDIKLVEGSSWDLFSVEQTPDLLVNLVSNGVLDFLENKVTEFAIFRLDHADVVRSINEAVASHFMSELIWHISLKPVIEVSDDFLRLALHLHVVDFGDKDGVVEALSVLSQPLDDIVEVGAGLLTIGRQVVHFYLGLLGEDVCLNVVVIA